MALVKATLGRAGAPAITTRLYCKVNPVSVCLLLYQQFIEILVVQIWDVEQYRGIAQSLLNADAADIYGTTRKINAPRVLYII